MQRFNLKNLKVTRKSASTDAKAASAFLPRLKEIIEENEYLLEQVFNCDKAGLFRKKMPSCAYIHQSEKQAEDFKACKDQLPPVLCANAADHMIKPGLSYRGKNPCAPKNNMIYLPVFWQHNHKTRMTATLFLK